MNQENLISNIKPPEIKKTDAHKRQLKNALLFAHQNRSVIRVFSNLINNSIENMSIIKKTLVISTSLFLIFFLGIGVFGSSAESIAYADAQRAVNRGFAFLANLPKEKREELEEKFQDRIQFKDENHEKFMGIKEFSEEEFEARKEQMKISLAESLVEAQNAPDLQVISADDMPLPGFFGKAGRAVGLPMRERHMNFEDKIDRLPEEVKDHFEERANLHKEMESVSFLSYTDSEGRKIILGINADGEPVVKFVLPKETSRLSSGRELGEKGPSPRLRLDLDR